jgi:hypothetical protein
MRANIKTAMYQLLPTALLAFLGNIIAKLTGNALFPTPPVPLAGMQTLYNELEAAIEAATDGGTAAREHRNKKVAEVRDLVRVTADYVRAQCDGDAEKLATSGYPLAKRPEPINFIGVPKFLGASATDVSGEVKLAWGKADGSRIFRVERADSDPTAGPTTWTTVGMVSRQRFVVGGLKPYEANWFRVVAIGKDKEGLPSDVVLGRAA